MEDWARKFDPVRWGVVTGKGAGIVVVDFDGDAGREWMRLWGIHPHVATGSGGFHVYLKHPGWHVPTLNAKSSGRCWPWPGVDIRGDGGFALVLGHNCNGPYVHVRALVPDSFAVLPKELRDFLRKNGVAAAVPRRANPHETLCSRAVSGCPEVSAERLIARALDCAAARGRNNAGFWLACQLRDNGYPFDLAVSAMGSYRSRASSNNVKGQPEIYSEREMRLSVRGAYSTAPRCPWGAARQGRDARRDGRK